MHVDFLSTHSRDTCHCSTRFYNIEPKRKILKFSKNRYRKKNSDLECQGEKKASLHIFHAEFKTNVLTIYRELKIRQIEYLIENSKRCPYHGVLYQTEIIRPASTVARDRFGELITNRFSLSRLMCGFPLRYTCEVTGLVQLIRESRCKTVVPCVGDFSVI